MSDKKKEIKLDLGSLPAKVNAYKKILDNTIEYRKDWKEGLKDMIIDTLNYINDSTKLGGKVIVRDHIENMEAVVLDLGRVHSGMRELIQDSDIKKTIVKTQGGLIYQQLFNGKVMVMIVYPYIDGYGEPRPPKNVEILRPEELKQGFILRHFQEFIKEITEWEDYDDDRPNKPILGYTQPIGFNTGSKEEIIVDEDQAIE
jgi:hypothetical protein